MTNPPKICVALTGLNAIDNPGSGLGVARALKEDFGENIRIIGLAYENLEPAIYLKEQIDKTYKIPYPADGTDSLLNRLAFIQQKEHIDVLIPNFDAELTNFIKIEGQLALLGIKTYLPSLAQFQQRDKLNLYAFGKGKGLCIPPDIQINKETELHMASIDLGFPLVIKGKFYDAIICHHLADTYKAYHQLSAKWGLPIIVQKYINGTEFNIAGLGDGKGNIISAIPMRKLFITEKGKAWAGISIEDEAMIDLAFQFAKASQWRGAFELEVVKDHEGRLFIIEINPRFPAWIYLSVAAGQNQPKALVQMATGQEINKLHGLKGGKMFVRYAWDHVIDVEEFQKLAAFGEL
ncbi:ATP-grasp domain-containing protein [Pedobacter sp. ASV28]|uniref:ATP-grasp domain-containing protein n=1 Tax=Pedobacter sp. ASV28 TaxID=2795123 RepID=UPI0018EDA491|nr:ATP-grasp domain-containing protein [Pedobacter sp. ASV28]